jgi:hypothetical protein
MTLLAHSAWTGRLAAVRADGMREQWYINVLSRAAASVHVTRLLRRDHELIFFLRQTI